MTGSAGQIPVAVRALLVERRTRLYAQDRFTASTRRAAWRLIHTARKDTP